MKKIVICTFLVAAGAATLLNINNKIESKNPEFMFKTLQMFLNITEKLL